MEKKTNYLIGQHGNLYFTDLRIDKYRQILKHVINFLLGDIPNRQSLKFI